MCLRFYCVDFIIYIENNANVIQWTNSDPTCYVGDFNIPLNVSRVPCLNDFSVIPDQCLPDLSLSFDRHRAQGCWANTVEEEAKGRGGKGCGVAHLGLRAWS